MFLDVNQCDSKSDMPPDSLGPENLFQIDFKIDPKIGCNHMVTRADADINFVRLKFDGHGNK